jgi:deoxyribodipyrimidine photo-lyase
VSRAHSDKLDRFISEAAQDYDDARNRPDMFGTSRLSPHLHFGEISPLQCWHAMRHAMDDGRRNIDKGGETFLKEILWREFSYHLVCNFENFMTEPFNEKFADFPWADDEDGLRRGRRARPATRLSMPACVSCGQPAGCTTGCA